jgi:hypothetical protein
LLLLIFLSRKTDSSRWLKQLDLPQEKERPNETEAPQWQSIALQVSTTQVTFDVSPYFAVQVLYADIKLVFWLIVVYTFHLSVN